MEQDISVVLLLLQMRQQETWARLGLLKNPVLGRGQGEGLTIFHNASVLETVHMYLSNPQKDATKGWPRIQRGA